AAIRFYKGAANTGAYAVMLYSSSGALLGQANYTGTTTASGWQQVNFATPVAIAANTTYVAAYFTTSGFAYDGGYFTNTGVDNAPLHALRSGVDGPNGLYFYGSAPQFPSSSYNDSNYWVDVVYSAGLPPAFSNLALGKAATESSTLPGTPTVVASAAVD